MAEDIFDAVVLLEETQTEEGRQAGLRDGREQGQQQGHDTGFEKGKEIASEVAFYDGCAQVWRHKQLSKEVTLSERVDKALTTLEKLIDSIPLDEPSDERLLDMLGDMRSKFKIVANAMKLKDASSGQPSPLPSHTIPTTGHDAADLNF